MIIQKEIFSLYHNLEKYIDVLKKLKLRRYSNHPRLYFLKESLLGKMKFNARFLQSNFINEMSYFDQMSEEIYEKLHITIPEKTIKYNFQLFYFTYIFFISIFTILIFIGLQLL